MPTAKEKKNSLNTEINLDNLEMILNHRVMSPVTQMLPYHGSI